MTIIVILFIFITYFLWSIAEISLWQPRQTGLVICRGPTTMGESLFSQKKKDQRTINILKYDSDTTVDRQWRRKIRLLEDNAKCCDLKTWPVKGLCDRCLSVWSPDSHISPPLHTVYVSDSYPAFFLPIATTSNKNFWKWSNCKWEMQMFRIWGRGAIKQGLLCSLSAFPSFIKPGTRQTGLTGRFQKSFDVNNWHSLRKGEKIVTEKKAGKGFSD